MSDFFDIPDAEVAGLIDIADGDENADWIKQVEAENLAERVINSGTTQGAIKGWEVRRGQGVAIPQPRNVPSGGMQEFLDMRRAGSVVDEYAHEHPELEYKDETFGGEIERVSDPASSRWGHIAVMRSQGGSYSIEYLDCQNNVQSAVGAIKDRKTASQLFDAMESDIAIYHRPDKLSNAPAPTSQTATEEQLKAGNYKKRKIAHAGLTLSIENEKGEVRSGVGKDGKRWDVTMPAAYGYILGTLGRDKDHVDAYVNEPLVDAPVFVIDQQNAESGAFDEHKCFLGFPDEAAVRATYEQAFSDGKAKDRLGGLTQMSMDEFLKWLNGDTTKKLSNTGQPCGESFIESGDVCHVGDGTPIITHMGREFTEPSKGVLVLKGSPPKPPDSTPAYHAWQQKYTVWKSSTDGLTWDERRTKRLHSPDDKERKDAEKDQRHAEGEEEVALARGGVAAALGFPRRGDTETQDAFAARIKAIEDNPDSPFNRTNPNQTHTLDYKGNAYTLPETAMEAWTFSSDRAHIWNRIAAELAGKDPRAEAMEFYSNVRPSIRWEPIREYFDKPPDKDKLEHFDRMQQDRWKMWQPYKDEYIGLLDKIDVLAKEKYKLGWDAKDRAEEDRLKAEIKAASNRTSQLSNMISGVSMAMLNPYSENEKRGILQLRDEARASLKKPIEIYRGMMMKDDDRQKVEDALAKDGHYDLPMRRISSWTTNQKLAGVFAKYGQGQKNRDHEGGIVVKSFATDKNVWMHPGQPTYQVMSAERKKTGAKFHSGGTDQKEVVVESSEPFIRLTKDNVEFIN